MELHSTTIHGLRVGLRRAGSGPVLLLVHGMASSSAVWTPALPALAERFTILAPDLLGHGQTGRPAGDYSLGAHASLLRDVLLLCERERATLVGHSFGGGVALQFAYQFPEYCERLVLVGSGGLGREVHLLLRALALPGAEQVLSLFCAPSISGAGDALAGWARRLGFEPTAAAAEVSRAYAWLADPHSRTAFLQTLRSVIDRDGQKVSAIDRLHLAANMPTLIVWGEKDPIIPVEHARRAHAAIAGSRLEVFEGAGHYPHCDDPSRFARAVLDFVDATEPARLSQQDLRVRLPITHAGQGSV